MTFPEVLTRGKACLEEYHPRLKRKCRGERKPFSGSASEIKRRLECNNMLSHVAKEEIERVSKEVLEELVGLKDGFVMSDPRPKEDSAPQNDTVYHNGFYLSFNCGYDIKTNREVLWVDCRYYPVG